MNHQFSFAAPSKGKAPNNKDLRYRDNPISATNYPPLNIETMLQLSDTELKAYKAAWQKHQQLIDIIAELDPNLSLNNTIPEGLWLQVRDKFDSLPGGERHSNWHSVSDIFTRSRQHMRIIIFDHFHPGLHQAQKLAAKNLAAEKRAFKVSKKKQVKKLRTLLPGPQPAASLQRATRSAMSFGGDSPAPSHSREEQSTLSLHETPARDSADPEESDDQVLGADSADPEESDDQALGADSADPEESNDQVTSADSSDGEESNDQTLGADSAVPEESDDQVTGADSSDGEESDDQALDVDTSDGEESNDQALDIDTSDAKESDDQALNVDTSDGEESDDQAQDVDTSDGEESEGDETEAEAESPKTGMAYINKVRERARKILEEGIPEERIRFKYKNGVRKVERRNSDGTLETFDFPEDVDTPMQDEDSSDSSDSPEPSDSSDSSDS